jgi:hypothetical protein
MTARAANWKVTTVCTICLHVPRLFVPRAMRRALVASPIVTLGLTPSPRFDACAPHAQARLAAAHYGARVLVEQAARRARGAERDHRPGDRPQQRADVAHERPPRPAHGQDQRQDLAGAASARSRPCALRKVPGCLHWR